MIVGPNSRVVVNRVELGGPGWARHLSVKLVHGEVAVRDRFGGRTVVFTPWASATAMGASFGASTQVNGTLVLVAHAGEVQVSAAGRMTRLRAGMVTAVPRAGPPLPASVQLDAPVVTSARYDEELADRLAWGKVAGATQYRVVFSRDAAGLYVISERAAAVNALEIGVAPAGPKGFWWRVCGVDALNAPGKFSPMYHWIVPPPGRGE
jgi:hypothetical protein